MSKRRNKKNRLHSKSGKNRTPISGHTRSKNELIPPFAAMDMAVGGKIAFSSWMNNRLPEMIWAALIRASVKQDYALGQFRRILNFLARHASKESLSDITLTGISKLDESTRGELIAFIIEPPETAHALATLRLFESLPARDTWDKLLPNVPPDVPLLMRAVGATLWHQSQEATDCRWLRIMGQVVTDRFHIPGEIAEEWFGYPNVGDQRSVRPNIRAAEIAPDSLEPPDLTWPNAFWDEAWKNTPCLILTKKQTVVPFSNLVTLQRVKEIRELICEHWENTHNTTAIDARHDAVFGMALYAIRVLEELMAISIGSSILGRLGIRTIFEVHVNLRYLLTKDDQALWQKWRAYGAGQAKLNALKFDDAIEPPKYIAVDSIEQIAGEDIWEEFLTINLASWSGADLRKLSEIANLKPVYDRHYSWTSGYAHGTWGPIRESCFETCGNPLHRLHRYPENRSLADVVDEATALIDGILVDLNVAYPSFTHRLRKTAEHTA
jgi:hypothetical protein